MLLVARLRSGVTCIRSIWNSSKTTLKPETHNRILIRRAGSGRIGYRCLPPDDPIIETIADTFMTVIWCYLFWMFYHEGSTLINYGVDYPDYSTATDAELGLEEEED